MRVNCLRCCDSGWVKVNKGYFKVNTQCDCQTYSPTKKQSSQSLNPLYQSLETLRQESCGLAWDAGSQIAEVQDELQKWVRLANTSERRYLKLKDQLRRRAK